MEKVAIIGATLLLSIGLVACGGGSGPVQVRAAVPLAKPATPKSRLKRVRMRMPKFQLLVLW